MTSTPGPDVEPAMRKLPPLHTYITKGYWHVGEAEFDRADWIELRRKRMTVIQRYQDVVAIIWDADDGGHRERRANAEWICSAIDTRDELLCAAKKAEELLRNGGTVPIKGEAWQALSDAIERAER